MGQQRPNRSGTSTARFGSGRREGHDASAFYARFTPPVMSDDDTVARPEALLSELGRGRLYTGSIDRLRPLPENSVALVVTSPPYFVGKEYELAVTADASGDRADAVPTTYFEYLDMLRGVFAECVRVLEPGGRIAINVANLGRKPYRSLSADVIGILQDDLGLLLRCEIIWEKSETSSGSCAWGSFARPSNPVLRDMTERVVVASKGRFSRARSAKQRRAAGLPSESTMTNDEFLDVTRDVWRIDAESARRVGHPAPFPVELPRRLIDLYTYRGDIVVDPFVGSGTTLVAAARTGRIGVGFDTDPDYVAAATQRLEAELDRLAAGPLADRPSPEDRQEYAQARALAEGRKVTDIARRVLTDAGFSSIDDKARHRSRVVEFDFRVAAADAAGGNSAADAAGVAGAAGGAGANGAAGWWVDVAGGFTTTKPGLQRTDLVWKLLGRLHVLAAGTVGADSDRGGDGGSGDRVLVITPSLPRPGSPGDRALRAVGPGVLFDVIELYDPAGEDRLRHYAANPHGRPRPGFWSPSDLQ